MEVLVRDAAHIVAPGRETASHSIAHSLHGAIRLRQLPNLPYINDEMMLRHVRLNRLSDCAECIERDAPRSW